MTDKIEIKPTGWCACHPEKGYDVRHIYESREPVDANIQRWRETRQPDAEIIETRAICFIRPEELSRLRALENYVRKLHDMLSEGSINFNDAVYEEDVLPKLNLLLEKKI